MRQFIYNILVFVAWSLLFTSPIIIFSRYDNLDKLSSPNNNIQSLQNKSGFQDLDILFVGNSYCYSGIQPKIIDSAGFNTYNLGISTAGVDFYDLIINDYLDHVSRKPKSIFILVSPMTFSSMSDNFLAYPIHRYLETPLSNLELARRYDLFNKLFLLLKKSFTKGISNLAKNKNKPAVDGLLKERGFVKNDAVVTSKIINDEKPLYRTLAEDNFDKSKIDKLIARTASLESRGIKVIYFELPTNIVSDFFNQGFLNDYEKGLESLSKSNALIRLDKNLFSGNDYRNIDHMNTNGSKKASRELLNLINKSGILSDNSDKKPD